MKDDVEALAPAEDSTYVVKRRDYADIIQLQKATVMEEFLAEPLTVIAECTAGWLRLGTKELLLAVPKVALAALKGKVFEQFGHEFENWRKSGRIPDDFAEKRCGYQSWVQLLSEIDSDPTDEDRLDALKAMFLATNRIDATEGERVLAYQLFQIAKKLSSGDLLVLKVASTLHGPTHESAQNWLAKIANSIGHNATAIIELHERVLVEYGLISPRFDQNLKVVLENGRLTDLGLAFCRRLQDYVDVAPLA
jgi:hypothetical protein